MLARTRSPSKQAQAQALSPTLLREAVEKVDKCVRRLRELRSVAILSPRRNVESVGAGNTDSQWSAGEQPENTGAWRRMSLPAMLLGETVCEIVQESKFVWKALDESVSSSTNKTNPPMAERPRQEQDSQLHRQRKTEKRTVQQTEFEMPSSGRAKYQIGFNISSLRTKGFDKENYRYMANKVSPRNRPWSKKAVLFPNPLFHPCHMSNNQRNLEAKSPVIPRDEQNPQKLKAKSPWLSSNYQGNVKSNPHAISPRRVTSCLGKMSQEPSASAIRLRR